MAHNFASMNDFRDLWMSISSKHITYLCEDKSPEKLKHQNLLQNYINEFIFNVPHKHKFSFAKTAEVLQRSVYSAKFNALKAASAWLSLSTYANNLYSQPWRKEYHEIKLYSGFYKHQIENCLSGAEVILELMGYKLANGDKMVIEKPVNLNQLAAASLDALVAMCECQVIFSIFKEISKHIPTVTWVDILRVRELYTGPPEQMIHVIISLYAYPADCCNECLYNHPHRYQSAPECRRCALTRPATACLPINGYRTPAYHPSASIRYQLSAPAPPFDHLPFANGHYHHQVPTAKLIDYEDTLDGYPHPMPPSSSSSAASRRQLSAVNNERWNVTNDCLPSSFRYRKTAESRYPSSSESISYDDDAVQTRHSRPSLQRGSGSSVGAAAAVSGSSSSHGSSRKRDQSCSSEMSHRTKSVAEDEAVARNNLSSGNVVAVTSASAVAASTEVESNGQSAPAETSSTPTWECAKCTYYNALQNDVCEMCGRSKNIPVETPLVSGGKHCGACTLVNKREATRCEACDNSLENSPTYV